MTENNNLEHDIVSVKLEQKHILEYIDKLDQTMAKMTEVSSNLSKMIAVQESRISRIETNLHSLEAKFTHHLEREVQERTSLHDRVSNLRVEINNNILDISGKFIDKLDKSKEVSKTAHDELKRKISRIEKYIWVAIGGLGVVAFLLTNIDPEILHALQNLIHNN